MKDGVGAYAALTRAADTARAGGDPRTRGQVMADTLVGSVLGAAARWGLAAPDESETTPDTGVALGLVMTDAALLGTSDDAAYVDGFGPVPAELAREIVAGAVLTEEAVWLRRLYTSPTSGRSSRWTPAPVCSEAASPGSSGSATRSAEPRGATPRSGTLITRRASTSTARPVPTTVRACVWPATTPSRPLAGGPEPRPRGRPPIDTTTPTGHTYRSRAPAIATIREVPIRIEYLRRLTGWTVASELLMNSVVGRARTGGQIGPSSVGGTSACRCTMRH